MKIEKADNKKAVVSPEGSIDFTNSEELGEQLTGLLEDGFNQIVIDFRKIDTIDSSGLGKLLFLNKKIRERNGELKFVNIESDYILNTFKMIKLNQVIEIEGLD